MDFGSSFRTTKTVYTTKLNSVVILIKMNYQNIVISFFRQGNIRRLECKIRFILYPFFFHPFIAYFYCLFGGKLLIIKVKFTIPATASINKNLLDRVFKIRMKHITYKKRNRTVI